jgi:hypothetical protein
METYSPPRVVAFVPAFMQAGFVGKTLGDEACSIIVSEVYRNSKAYAAGLRVGHVISRVNGKGAFTDDEAFEELLDELDEDVACELEIAGKYPNPDNEELDENDDDDEEEDGGGAENDSDATQLPLHSAVSALGRAARGGDGAPEAMERLTHLLSDSPDELRACDAEGRLPLHLALETHAPTRACLAILRAYPAAATISDSKQRLPLHVAAAHSADPTEMLPALIAAAPTACEACDCDKNSPLAAALAARAQQELTLTILAACPKVAQQVNGFNKLPIMVAFEKNASEAVVAALLAAYPDCSLAGCMWSAKPQHYRPLLLADLPYDSTRASGPRAHFDSWTKFLQSDGDYALILESVLGQVDVRRLAESKVNPNPNPNRHSHACVTCFSDVLRRQP